MLCTLTTRIGCKTFRMEWSRLIVALKRARTVPSSRTKVVARSMFEPSIIDCRLKNSIWTVIFASLILNPKIIVQRPPSKLESNLDVMMNIGQIINHPSKLTQQQCLQQPPNKHSNNKRRNDPNIYAMAGKGKECHIGVVKV